MSENSKIEWTDHTFNPWIGCTKVSSACDHCYAEVSTAARALGVEWGQSNQRHRTSQANWKLPLRWNANHDKFFAEHGRRQRVFSASLADVFDNRVDPAWRKDLFDLIESTPNLDWLLLTKRISNVPMMITLDGAVAGNGFGYLPDNVWLGITICNQEEADRDIPKLLQVPAAVRFLSMEPLLGPVDLTGLWSKQTGHKAIAGPIPTDYYSFINWVIVGGESGPYARPMHPDWARSLRDQCAAADVPFLFKQWGEYVGAIQTGGRVAMQNLQSANPGVRHGDVFLGDTAWAIRAGKKAAGRLLDGRTHDEFPKVLA
jgi:protein gp37